LACILLIMAGGAAGGESEPVPAEDNPRLALPRSHLGQPFEGETFLAVHGGAGGGYQGHDPRLGLGGSLIFRPGSTLNIFDGLFGWNTGMVLQADYLELQDDGRIMSYDLILRRYFADRGERKTEVRMFLGLGSGLSEITPPRDYADSKEDFWSLLVEGGQEWFFKPTHHLFVKAQYRWMISSGRTFRTWTLMAGIGIPLP
jgi:hypothetical protein